MARQVHAVGVIFENENGEILVLRRHPRDPEGTTWGLVGGKVDPGEDKTQTAARETQEEIGHAIDPSQLRFLKTYHWDRADLDITFEVFTLKTLAKDVTLELDQNESTEHMWAHPRDLQKRPDLMRASTLFWKIFSRNRNHMLSWSNFVLSYNYAMIFF